MNRPRKECSAEITMLSTIVAPTPSILCTGITEGMTDSIPIPSFTQKEKGGPKSLNDLSNIT